MKKIFVLTMLVAFVLTAILGAPALAQKKQTPKGIWRGMLANVSDVQSIVASFAVFDMKRIAAIADKVAKTQDFWAKFPKFSDPWKKAYAKSATSFRELSAAARTGDEQVVAEKIGGVLQACASCHYNLRDAPRRK
ncbi:MAG: hypothetical protein ACE5JS_17330 [Nitrospinota bacterium]